MKSASIIIFLSCLLYHLDRSHSAPGRTVDEVLLGEVDISLQDNSLEITTEEPFTKKCIVNGNNYSHSQTIPSSDSNSHCLCVAGEVYCWWQTYHSNADSLAAISSSPSTILKDSHIFESSTDSMENLEASGEASDEMIEGNNFDNNTTTTSESPISSSTCNIMGRVYQQGETLPQSTGNCVECSCGPEGRIKCSPKDCVALKSAISSDNPSDGEFEVLRLDRNGEIDESF
ncbi:uncharacterized protein LOC117176042 [Belonocnema kinseyi]|uniref:uncharacterized protein LOC117176042 n=1 Tax=Belonocnema kinseyi TaxID=2817044 RepID=UPI00143E0BAA|nr:uncharacterized protein LOC117176042 [Belonocnema kinseyi]